MNKMYKILIHDIGLHRLNCTFIAWSWFCDILDFFSIVRIRAVLRLLDNASVHWLVIPSFQGKSIRVYKPLSLMLMRIYERKGDKILVHIHDRLLDNVGRNQLEQMGLHPLNRVIHTRWRGNTRERDNWVNIHFPLLWFRMRKGT